MYNFVCMNIEHYISQLLYRYQCVTVPGFGAFLTEIQSAQWVESANSFYPPKKLISFNTNIKNNDGLLANHIARAEKTSYEYAISAIQYQVLNWKKELEQNRALMVKNVGSFVLGATDNLIFTPSEQKNYLTSSFGLSSFIAPAVKREATEEIPAVVEEREVIALVPEERSGRSYLKYAAIFILGLGLAGTAAYSVWNNQIETQTVLVEKAVQKKVESKIQEATFFIKSPMAPVTLSVKANKEEKEEIKLPYHVVAGAFRDESNANQVVKKLKKLGYNARRLDINEHGLYPVLYGSFATYAEAQKLKNEVRESENPEAWLLVQSL
ncbi:Cell division protein DedD (protein involved in septation) [Flavobacterium glycines]|uniref:Cell division protein DedD (Protein involved in septation) n=2 Tax=Flavobacterium glycines TaxID=551990 RepID=A0A1G8MCE5_9FLAO|nr:Cell division protein DedD (protein involved in septation) [Flavobacterium glycines]